MLFLLSVFGNAATQASDIDFVRDVRPIFQKHCYSCHGPDKQKSGLRLDIKSAAFNGGDGYGPSLVAGNAADSPLFELVTSDDEYSRMPPADDSESTAPLSAEEISILKAWIDAGAIWPDGVDLAKLENRLDHWSFKPMKSPEIPTVDDPSWAHNFIDRFIQSRLSQEGLSPSASADHTVWLRRVTLDLTGLPPTPSEVTAFLQDAEKQGEAAYVAVVDRLLKSPRYGERWGQHWLDVARYADTHGFEVNTERPNAWPYRDYVIAAFNNDTPYDQFIREQLVGDAMGVDAATGFLVTASVLLPGQIGKDAPSIRLARQDSLDEIVNNIGQGFLGLSVGCARCHDHKFDPITAKDYYSMQAFVAGVEYADREIQTPESEAKRKEAKTLHHQVAKLDSQLTEFVPLAKPREEAHSEREMPNAKSNVHSFSPINAKFVRFTIHDSNLHPSLGLIEPCIDEFEIFTADSEPKNIALASAGTKVSASGSRTSARHKLEHVNDGRYGNESSWMSDSKGRGWLMFELPTTTAISKVVWGRDRNGELDDRLATAFRLEVGSTPDSLQTVAAILPPRQQISPIKNIDRFTPVLAKKLRFTVLSTNNLEPCIDELEVLNTAGENVALSSQGTTIRTSGDIIVADRHQPDFINDGEYGNSRSWLSNAVGTGWIELEFAEAQLIDRVVWGRDRNGKFKDRLPTDYRIEIAIDDRWQLLADATDRQPWNPDRPSEKSFTVGGLPEQDARDASRLLRQKKKLESRIAKLQNRQKAFAGQFRQPDEIHLLRRGDPEQPADLVTPAALSAIGDLRLPNSTPEQRRRVALAEWITSPQNPLTARVMANRIWQWHFGIGLVETANDFGRNGALPSHPELLDRLALELIDSDWSVKHMHRLIVLSSTYRQSGSSNAKATAVDADVRLLWRYPSRRLEGEAIRDSMLAVSGQLNLSMGGRGFDLFNRRGGLTGFSPIESFSGEGLRRMIYAHKVRRERDGVFGAFDCPDAGQSTPRRVQSTTPIQALNLFNSRLTLEQSDAFADRVIAEVGDDTESQVQLAYTIALGRPPSAVELSDAEQTVQRYGLPTLCRVLFNSNEFLFLP
ncbi:PSD1 and planctomycete cytochrome C domain-containing protein [Roseiconus sp. JC912]|uniref:PSD1 and planctomycete cytochrome C domain-containing protein n=1 Tax=Roseiconus sp. JC912 TaxID=3396307 RepID=UPI003A4C66A5